MGFTCRLLPYTYIAYVYSIAFFHFKFYKYSSLDYRVGYLYTVHWTVFPSFSSDNAIICLYKNISGKRKCLHFVKDRSFKKEHIEHEVLCHLTLHCCVVWFSPPPNANPPSPFSSTSTSTCPLHHFRHLHQLPAISADLQTLHSVADKCIANVPEIFRHILIEEIASCCILCLLQQSLCKASSCITLTCHLHLIPLQSHKRLFCCPYRFS